MLRLHTLFSITSLIVSYFILFGCTHEAVTPLITKSLLEPAGDIRPDTLAPPPFPALITEIPLAPQDEQIRAMLLDSKANRLYVTDSSGQLHILDTGRYDVLQTIPLAPDYAPRLTLAVDQNKLFVTADRFSTVVDTQQLTTTHIISPGGHIALDTARNRFFIGSRRGNTPVQMYDLTDLSLIDTLVQTGTPFYNPAREELYFLSDQLQGIDLKSLAPITVPLAGKLSPSIRFYRDLDLYFLPASNGLIFDFVDYFSISGRPSSANYYTFFDAATLKEITDPDTFPHTEFSCFGGLIVPKAIPGLRLHYDPFETYRFQIEDAETGQRTWYEGVKLGRTNPHTKQIYHNSMVFDLPHVKPLGLLPAPACIELIEPETGRLFGVRQGTLVIFSETGGDPLNLPPLPVDTLPKTLEIAGVTYPAALTNIKFSPTYSRDQTIILDGRPLYRSTDGGRSWAQLRGGLPDAHNYINLSVAFSPNFAHDQTLFAVQRELNQEISFGLYGSSDGGDTWQPLNEGLTRLGVYQVEVSPDFSHDDTLLIQSAYNALAGKYLGPYAFHYATLRSTDRGQSWTQVVTRTDHIGSPAPPLPVTASPVTHFRWTDHNRALTIQRSQDGGLTWTDVFTLPDYVDPTETSPYGQVISVSPNFARDPIVFIHVKDTVYRSADGGATWQAVPFAEQPLGLIFSPNFAADQTVYSYAGREFYRSTDKGETWISITPARPPASTSNTFSQLIFSPNFIENRENRLMLTTLGAYIFSTTDAGDSWHLASLPITDTQSGYIRGVTFSPDSEALFASYGNQLFRLVDQGRTWTAALPYSADTLHFSPTYRDDQTLYFYEQDYLHRSVSNLLFRSTDGGETWQQWHVAETWLNSGSDTYIGGLLISPADQHGRHQLFFILITPTERQIIRLNPAEMAWSPVIAPTPTPQ